MTAREVLGTWRKSRARLAEDRHHVLLVVRNESLAAGIARYLRDRIAEDPGVDVLLGHEVRAVSGGEQLEQVGAFGDAEDD